MKTTQERLKTSYCRPQKDEEWVSLIGYVPSSDHRNAVYDNEVGVIDALDSELLWLKEIPVHHFIDLVHDRITTWRLEDDGFWTADKFKYAKCPHCWQTVTVDLNLKQVTVLDAAFNNVQNYTDLINLIRLIA